MPIIRSLSGPSTGVPVGVDEDAGDVGDDAALGELLALLGAAWRRTAWTVRAPTSRDPTTALVTEPKCAKASCDLRLLAHGGRRRGVRDDERRVEEVGRPAGDPRGLAHQLDRVVVGSVAGEGPGQLDDRRGGEPGQRGRHRADRARPRQAQHVLGRDDLAEQVGRRLAQLLAQRARGGPRGSRSRARGAARAPPAAGRTGRRRWTRRSRSRCAPDRWCAPTRSAGRP